MNNPSIKFNHVRKIVEETKDEFEPNPKKNQLKFSQTGEWQHPRDK